MNLSRSLASAFLLIFLISIPVTAEEVMCYDFIEHAPEAIWTSGAGRLTFPGSSSDNSGFARYLYDVDIGLGGLTTPIHPRVLETHPEWVSEGYIRATYPTVIVAPETEIYAMFRLLEGAGASDGVTFEIKWNEDGTSLVRTLETVDVSYGEIKWVHIPLRDLWGKTGKFMLHVDAGPSSAQDWAIWIEAKIQRYDGYLTILTDEIDPATTGQYYTQQLEACGGDLPYKWEIFEGTLPPGLVLNEYSGLISGMPSSPGEYSFGVRVCDNLLLDGPRCSHVKEFSINVNESISGEGDFSLLLDKDEIVLDSITNESFLLAQVSHEAGPLQEVSLSVSGMPDHVYMDCPTSTQCTWMIPFSEEIRFFYYNDSVPQKGDYPLTITAIAHGISRSETVVLHIDTGDLRLVSIEPVQVVYGAPLVKGKETVFRAKVQSTFSQPLTTSIRLTLPEDDWYTNPPSTGNYRLAVLPSWQYPEIWGPIEILPGENEIILPIINEGDEDRLFSYSYPQGIIEGRCIDGICGPDVRCVPRPKGESVVIRGGIDPENEYIELSENNNYYYRNFETIGTKSWKFLFIPYRRITDEKECSPAVIFIESGAKRQLEYLLGNFPIADSSISYSILPGSVFPCPGYPTTMCTYATTMDTRIKIGNAYNPAYEDIGTFASRLATLAKTDFDFAVGITCGSGGQKGHSEAVVIGDSSGRDSVVLAHEFNHATTGMPDIYSLDCLVGWDEAYCEYPNGYRTYCCYVDRTPPTRPYCEIIGGEVVCEGSYTQNCVASCNCSVYPGRWESFPECYDLPKCNSTCCWDLCPCSGGQLYHGPDARIIHSASEGFWVNRWIPISTDFNYFMDGQGGPTFPNFWIRLENTSHHCSGAINQDGYLNLIDSERFKRTTDPECLLVSGTVHKSGTGTFNFIAHLEEGNLDIEEGTSGDFFIALIDERGNILGKSGFSPGFYVSDPDGGPVDEQEFTYRVAWHEDVQRIELQDSLGNVLAKQVVSSNVPTVQITSPNGGEKIPIGDEIYIRWTASDPDGDPLTYSVSISMDDGETWLPLDIMIEEQEYMLSTDMMEEGDNYRIKIRAYDGVNTGVDVSDEAFSISGDVGEAIQINKTVTPTPAGMNYIITIISVILGIIILTRIKK